MNLIGQFENLNPLRDEPGRIPVAVLLRDVAFDAVFYDTPGLTTSEKLHLLADLFRYEEGGMLLVYPEDADKRIEYYDLSHDLVEDHPDLDAVVVPGVGSSPLGASALARQVANIIGRPVVGIIAGYGAADMMSEALGGWFDFGLQNRTRAAVAELRKTVGSTATAKTDRLMKKFEILSDALLVDEPESNTLINIMLRQGHKIRLVVGHSKGAMNISNACHALVRDSEFDENAYNDLLVVTFGCGITLPPPFKRLEQFVGTLDALGNLNTPSPVQDDETVHWISGKAHNLCSTNPMHMPVDELLSQVLRLNRRVKEKKTAH